MTTTLLAELERAGVRLARDGDNLTIDAPAEFDLAPWLPRLKVLKLPLLAAIDWYAAVTARIGFDYHRANLLYVRLAKLERACLESLEASEMVRR